MVTPPASCFLVTYCSIWSSTRLRRSEENPTVSGLASAAPDAVRPPEERFSAPIIRISPSVAARPSNKVRLKCFMAVLREMIADCAIELTRYGVALSSAVVY